MHPTRHFVGVYLFCVVYSTSSTELCRGDVQVDDVNTLPMLIDFLLNVFTLNDRLMQYCALSCLLCFLALLLLLLRRRRRMLVPAKRFSKVFVTGLSEKVVRRVSRPK